ncbi:MAG: hypothetical protein FWC79_01535 [Oscillospiraceae bacterium]|nr:hypothetical protein [Oscillospiraceae bacterium]
MKSKIIRAVIIMLIIILGIGAYFIIVSNSEMCETVGRNNHVVEEELDRLFQEFANSGGVVERSHREGHLPTNDVKKKIEFVIADALQYGQTAKIVVTGLTHVGVGFPRVHLLIGEYDDDELIIGYRLSLVAMEKELLREYPSRINMSKDDFEDLLSEYKEQEYIMWKYTQKQTYLVRVDSIEFSYNVDPSDFVDGFGVRTTGFNNVEEVKINDKQDVIELARNEVIVSYDRIRVAYNPDNSTWRIRFSKIGWLGGCQTIYISRYGITKLSVFGE